MNERTLTRRRTSLFRRIGWLAVAALATIALVGPAAAPVGAAQNPGAIWTSLANGAKVNANIYEAKSDVYLNGGPQNCGGGGGLPDGPYYFQVTNPSGSVLLSTDAIKFRQVEVIGGYIHGVSGDGNHATGSSPEGCPDSLPVQLMPFADTPNPGGEYSVDVAPVAEVAECEGFSAGSTTFNFKGCVNTKNDNFKVRVPEPDPGSLLVTKTLAGNLTGFAGGDFVFSVSCDGENYGPVTINLASGSESADPITGIPAGAECTVTETDTPAAGANATWGDPAYDPTGGQVTIVSGQQAQVEVTNTRTYNPPPTPAISISKTNDADGPVEAGDVVDYTLTLDVTNGPVPAATIEDVLPAGLGTPSNISDGGTYTPATRTITWNLTNVADGKTLTYEVEVAATEPGSYTNTATITEGPCETACSDTSTVVVEPSPEQAVLLVHKTLDLPGNLDDIDGEGWDFDTANIAGGALTESVNPTDENGWAGFLFTLSGEGPIVVDLGETVQQDYKFVSAVCFDEEEAEVGTEVKKDAAVTGIEIPGGQTVICEFVNKSGEEEEATATPKHVTPPPTDTLGLASGTGSDSWRIVLLGIAALLATILLLTPAERAFARRRR
ncbi:MAG: hypothetical protein H6Q36_829 [Chloroflexi bacterium]|nr:hypothetical protein [Chloroflexota bacterium]